MGRLGYDRNARADDFEGHAELFVTLRYVTLLLSASQIVCFPCQGRVLLGSWRVIRDPVRQDNLAMDKTEKGKDLVRLLEFSHCIDVVLLQLCETRSARTAE